MRHIGRITVVVVGLLIASPAWLTAQSQGPMTPQTAGARDVTFLLGTWHVTETIYPGTEREYVERSFRTCRAILDDTYILCESSAFGRGRHREYWNLINQLEDGTVEFVGFFSNITQKSLYRGRFLEDGSGLDLRSYEIEDDAVTAGTHQRLRFISADEFEWTIGIRNPGTPQESVIGLERAVRVAR